MAHLGVPFAIEPPLSGRLEAVLEDWKSLLRGQAEIPFADDLDFARAERLCPDAFLLGVFERPRRFRFELASTPHAPEIARELLGRFIDEVELRGPLHYLRAQAEAAVESLAPSFYEHRPTGAEHGYGRLLLPAWGEGHVSALLGAVEFR